jgi:hypothetical protein
MIITRSSNGGSGLIGNSGRKTANACDKSAKDTTMDTAAHFMFAGENTSQKVYHLCAIALPTFAVRYHSQLVRPLALGATLSLVGCVASQPQVSCWRKYRCLGGDHVHADFYGNGRAKVPNILQHHIFG